MRVLIATVGARGDVAPFTGLATAMRAAGHSVDPSDVLTFAPSDSVTHTWAIEVLRC
jgi:sterol 3beta-glucosyltransferase